MGTKNKEERRDFPYHDLTQTTQLVMNNKFKEFFQNTCI